MSVKVSAALIHNILINKVNTQDDVMKQTLSLT